MRGQPVNAFAGGGHLGRSGLDLVLALVREGAWLLGAGCWAGGLEDEVGPGGVSPAPLPGVIGAVHVRASGFGAWGVGASGTVGCCCWAIAAGLNSARIGLKLRSAASAIAVKPSFTGISSSQYAVCQPSVTLNAGIVTRAS